MLGSIFLKVPYGDRVCLLFGLRRTGKTTMLRQALLDMGPEDLSRTAYIKASSRDTVADVNADLRELWAHGFRTVMIDEATLMADFIDGAALFSDVWAAQGMKIVLSGTDSLGFWSAERQELYDRAVTIHTTFIPFREHRRLLGIDDIDEYVRYGGTLRAGEIDFELGGIDAEAASSASDAPRTCPSSSTPMTMSPPSRSAKTITVCLTPSTYSRLYSTSMPSAITLALRSFC